MAVATPAQPKVGTFPFFHFLAPRPLAPVDGTYQEGGEQENMGDGVHSLAEKNRGCKGRCETGWQQASDWPLRPQTTPAQASISHLDTGSP